VGLPGQTGAEASDTARRKKHDLRERPLGVAEHAEEEGAQAHAVTPGVEALSRNGRALKKPNCWRKYRAVTRTLLRILHTSNTPQIGYSG